jgi:hypothetical protein
MGTSRHHSISDGQGHAVNDAMEIRARVDVVRDAGRDDRENVARARAAFIEPGEKPIFTIMASSP